MFLQSLRSFCKAQGWPGSVWKYSAALGRSPRVSVWCACGFETGFHFAAVSYLSQSGFARRKLLVMEVASLVAVDLASLRGNW
jgi:hypothetical protein